MLLIYSFHFRSAFRATTTPSQPQIRRPYEASTSVSSVVTDNLVKLNSSIDTCVRWSLIGCDRARTGAGSVVTSGRATHAWRAVRRRRTATTRRCVGRVTGTATRRPAARDRRAEWGRAGARPARSSSWPPTGARSSSASLRARANASRASIAIITFTIDRLADPPSVFAASSRWYLVRLVLRSLRVVAQQCNPRGRGLTF